jgi:MFS family permease
VESLDSAQAREQIEMIERILSESSQRLCYGAEYFIVWGLYSGAVTLGWQLIDDGLLPLWSAWAMPVLLVAAIAFSIVRGRMKQNVEQRRSLVQREFFNVLWLTLGMAFIVNVGAYRLMHGWASAVIWSFAEAIVLLFIGMHGNRRALIGGVLVVVSVVIANFIPPTVAGYVLAAGMVAGYAGFGVAELFAGD